MTVRQPRYSKEEFARRGDLIYETQVRPQVEAGNYGRIVAIDIETGAFEVANTPMEAVDRLYEREPDTQPWVIRIGPEVLKSEKKGKEKSLKVQNLLDLRLFIRYLCHKIYFFQDCQGTANEVF